MSVPIRDFHHSLLALALGLPPVGLVGEVVALGTKAAKGEAGKEDIAALDAKVAEMRHRGDVIATHPVLGGRHQLRILPEHGPGPIARNARLRHSTGGRSTGAVPFDVEVRDLSCYEAAYGLGGAR